jgi:hypothetical protein
MKKIVERGNIKIINEFESFGEKCLLLEQQVKYEDSTIEFRCTYISKIPKLWTSEIEKRLGSEATLYKVISNAPLITPYWNDKIKEGRKTLDDIAWGQVVKSISSPSSDLSFSFYDRIKKIDVSKDFSSETKFILDSNGKVQYANFFLSNTYKDDIDIRGSKNHPEYISKEIAAKLSKK